MGSNNVCRLETFPFITWASGRCEKYPKIHNLSTSVAVCIIRIRVRCTLLHILSRTHFQFLSNLLCQASFLRFSSSSTVRRWAHILCKAEFNKLLPFDLGGGADKYFHRTDSCNVYSVDLYSRNAQFSSPFGHRLFHPKYQDSNLIRLWSLRTKSFSSVIPFLGDIYHL
jgi:hypothetical protein